MEAGTFVIFSGKTPWFASSETSSAALSLAPVGKGKGPKKTATKNRATARTDPEPINPIFLEMSKLCVDPFWKMTLAEAATGKYHRGFGYTSGIITFKVRNKIHQCDISGLSPQDALPKVLQFMRTTGSVMSKRDGEERTQELKQMLINSPNIYPDSWGKIRSEQHRSILISKFIESVSSTCGLSEDEENQLENTIRIGITIKAFDSSSIHLKMGLIETIDGLYLDEHRKFRIEASYLPQPSKSHRRIEMKEPSMASAAPGVNLNLLRKWRRFIDSIN